jgi:hypothetical protein
MCQAGTCVDCFTLGCPEGMTCVEGANSTGICMSNPCMNVTCPQGQSCNASNGMCETVACAPACNVGQFCQAGTCVGSCSANACAGVTCQMGEVCRPSNGECIADPCASANCGTGTCSVSCEGTASCVVPAGVNVLAAGGSACAIGGAQGSNSGGALVVGLLGLGAVLGFRRRRR